MNDHEQILITQMEWQKTRQILTWPEKIRLAERVLESLRKWRVKPGLSKQNSRNLQHQGRERAEIENLSHEPILSPRVTGWDCHGNHSKLSSGMDAAPSPFWKSQPGLVWSNPKASNSAHIRAALLRRVSTVAGYSLSLEFGIERVRQEWKVLENKGSSETARAHAVTERILLHIDEGFSRAAA